MAQGGLFPHEPAAPASALPANRLTQPLAASFDRVPGGWRAVTEAFRHSPAGRSLIEFVDARVAAGAVVYPADPLRALALTPLEAVRVVILGQDPYHGPGQAEGLAFSVPDGVRTPPSLRNIFKELQREGLPAPRSTSLVPWARQGVLLLNTTLTVEDGQAASHAGHGWEVLTDALIAATAAAAADRPVAYLLWGAHAQRKRELIGELIESAGGGHLVLMANHPSPLSATRGPVPFIGCGHFGQAQAFCAAQGQPLDWRLG